MPKWATTLAVSWLLAGPASESRDVELRGVVKDVNGDPLADAIVVIQCECLTEPIEVRSNRRGIYRVGGLPPGRYTVQALSYDANRARVVDARRGETRVDFVLDPKQGGAERRTIEVDSPVPSDTTTGLKIEVDDVRHIPLGGTDRDFTGVIDVAPTATRDAAGIRLAGTTGAETKYVVDGVNVTNPAFGTVGATIVQEFVETVEVQEAGYQPEFGGATGGVVKARRLSGTNDTRGQYVLRYTPRLGNPRLVEGTDEAIRITETPKFRLENVFVIAGPIVKDRLFYSFGLAPGGQLNDLVQSYHHAAYDEEAFLPTFEEFDRNEFRTGHVAVAYQGVIDWAVTPEHRLRATVGGTPRFNRTTYRLPFTVDPNAFGNNPAIDPLSGLSNVARGVVNDHFGWDLDHTLQTSGGYVGRVARDRLEIDANVGYSRQRQVGAWRLDNPSLRQIPATSYSGYASLYELLDREESRGLVRDLEENCNSVELPQFPCPVRAWSTGGVGEYDDFTTERVQAHLHLTNFFDLVGPHQLKYGTQFEHIAEHSLFRYSGSNADDFTDNCPDDQDGGGEWCFDPHTGRYTLDIGQRVDNHRVISGSAFGDRTSTTGFGRARHETQELRAITSRIGTPARVAAYDETVSTQNYAAFLQDQWMVLPGLSLLGGVRWDFQDMRDIFGRRALLVWDNVAPRVGAVYDWTQEGKTRLFASYGRFYQQLPLLLNNRVFGGLMRVNGQYVVRDCQGRSVTVDGVTHPKYADGQPTEWCTDVVGRSSTASGIGAVVPRLRGMYSRQFQVGYDHELFEDFVLGVQWIHTALARGIEDVSVNGGQSFLVVNPGEPVARSDINAQARHCDELQAELDDAIATGDEGIDVIARELEHCNRLVDAFERAHELFPRPTRNYDAWTLRAQKRFGRGWMLIASYTYSRLIGNYDGFVDRDTGAINLGESEQFDIPQIVRNSFGPLNDDRPHLLKLDGYYTFSFKRFGHLTFGTSLRVMSGTPISYRVGQSDEYPEHGYLLPRGAAGRTPTQSTWSLSAAYGYPLGKVLELELAMRVINVTNAKTVTRVEELYTYDFAPPIQGGDLEDLKHAKTYPGASSSGNFGEQLVTPNPGFRAKLTYQQPVTGQAELRLRF